jgi:hypothetical protein
MLPEEEETRRAVAKRASDRGRSNEEERLRSMVLWIVVVSEKKSARTPFKSAEV